MHSETSNTQLFNFLRTIQFGKRGDLCVYKEPTYSISMKLSVSLLWLTGEVVA